MSWIGIHPCLIHLFVFVLLKCIYVFFELFEIFVILLLYSLSGTSSKSFSSGTILMELVMCCLGFSCCFYFCTGIVHLSFLLVVAFTVFSVVLSPTRFSACGAGVYGQRISLKCSSEGPVFPHQLEPPIWVCSNGCSCRNLHRPVGLTRS